MTLEFCRYSQGAVCVQGGLHISETEELRSALACELSAAQVMTLDLSGVESCDAASLQLLCSLKKSAMQVGEELHICALSAEIRESVAVPGLSLEPSLP
jgi:anti-anti-sigma factor